MTSPLFRRKRLAQLLCAASIAACAIAQDRSQGPSQGGSERSQRAADGISAFLSHGSDAELGRLNRELRRDRDVPSALRYAIAALHDHAGDRRGARRGIRDEAALRTVLEGLREEFPEQPFAYRGLLGLAQSLASREEEAEIARQLEGDVLAPTDTRNRARAILGRAELVGEDLSDLLRDIWPGRELGAEGTLLYTWSLECAESLPDALAWLKSVPAEVEVVAVCLDPDSPETRRLAAELGLPGSPAFQPEGADSLLCRRLSLDVPHAYVMANAAGAVESSGQLRHLGGE